jgi:hypothetical protein
MTFSVTGQPSLLGGLGPRCQDDRSDYCISAVWGLDAASSQVGFGPELLAAFGIVLFPNWLGQTQPRVVRIEGEDLYLGTAIPIHLQGKIVNSHLHWKRPSKV